MNQPVQDQISVNELQKLIENKADFTLLDVREPSEYEICNLKGKLIPLNTLPDHLSTLDKNKHIVIHCKLGGRSQQAVNFLKQNGFTHVSNLSGGIMAWIDKIDPTLKRY